MGSAQGHSRPYSYFESSRMAQTAESKAILGYVIAAFFLILVHDAVAEEKITFGYSSISPDMAGVWMAKDAKLFEKHGISADLVYISSGATIIQALVAGSVDVALGASNAVVGAILMGAPIIAIASKTNRPSM